MLDKGLYTKAKNKKKITRSSRNKALKGKEAYLAKSLELERENQLKL